MPVEKLTLELSTANARSHKDRHYARRSLKDKLRHSFNLSVAELDEGIVWNRATLDVVCVFGSTAYRIQQLEIIDKSAHRILTGLGAEITDSYAEILSE